VRVWVDADSCPRPVREIVARAAVRRRIETLFVANRPLPDAGGPSISFVEVGKGEGEADDYIIAQAAAVDLVVTRDIPLAAALVDRGLRVLNDRGELYTAENVGERLSVRDFMYELRSSGLSPERTGRFGGREAKAFADAFDRELARAAKGPSVPRFPGADKP